MNRAHSSVVSVVISRGTVEIELFPGKPSVVSVDIHVDEKQTIRITGIYLSVYVE